MTKKERLEQLEREVLQLHAEVAALKSKPDPWKPIGPPLNNTNYYTCQVCYGRCMLGGYHSCGIGTGASITWASPNWQG